MIRQTRLIVALDVPELARAKDLVSRLLPCVKLFKIGSQLFTAAGPETVAMVRRLGGDVFLDLKFHDIPHTVSEAGISARRLGVFMFNVHALGGATMLRTLMRTLCGDEDTCAAPVVLGVTVLTSMDRQQLNQCGVTRSVKNQVVHLARLCQRCGVHGVVCSGNELPILRRVMGDTFVLVVPGVRPTADARDDQKRVVTPAQAARAGADYIVVGRPIIDAKDPLAAAERVLEELRSGMPARNKQREAH